MGNGVGWKWPHHSAPKKLTIFRLEPTVGLLRLGERARKAQVEDDLVTVHPNPGPRDKTAAGKAARIERKKARRAEKRSAREVNAIDLEQRRKMTKI